MNALLLAPAWNVGLQASRRAKLAFLIHQHDEDVKTKKRDGVSA